MATRSSTCGPAFGSIPTTSKQWSSPFWPAPSPRPASRASRTRRAPATTSMRSPASGYASWCRERSTKPAWPSSPSRRSGWSPKAGRRLGALGKLAREYDAFVMAQAKARHPDLKDRFFNVGFIIDPAGEVILQHYKVSPLFPVEHSVCPHDVYDWWIEKYGRSLDAFWPVADTEIGRLGIMMANEGSYPENARALALNGAEVVYRASYPHPATGNELVEIQSRARALDNNLYLVAPNMGTSYPFPEV